MTDRTAEWDAALKRFDETGKFDNAGFTLALTSCPTCCDTGLDEGSPCLDCSTGLALISPEEKIKRRMEADATHHWVKDEYTQETICQNCRDNKGTLRHCPCPAMWNKIIQENMYKTEAIYSVPE